MLLNIKSIQASDFLSVNGTQIYLNENPFYFAGANNYYLWYKFIDCNETNPPLYAGCVTEVLDDAKNLGLGVIRTWGFGEGDNWGKNDTHSYSFQPYPGVYDERTFSHFDNVIAMAEERDIKLIITFVNNWIDFGGMCQYVIWCNISDTCNWNSNSHHDFYSNNCTKNIYKNYINYFLNRNNTVTGVKYKDDPTIFAWELANEPRSSDARRNEFYNWVVEMSQYIKSIDQNHLVTIGEEGWTSQGTNFIEDHSVDSIDFATFHLYPDHYGWSYAQTINWIDDRINDAHNVIGKPIVLEEMGKKQNRDSYFEGWYNELEEKGVNGDNFWILYDHTYPDYDEFGVYCPENITTCAIIANHASFMMCEIDADTDGDGNISMLELMAYIGRWKAGEVSMPDLMKAIGYWKAGDGC